MDLNIGRTGPNTKIDAQVQTFWESYSISRRYRKKIPGYKMKNTISCRYFDEQSVWRLQKSSFPAEVEIGVETWRPKEALDVTYTAHVVAHQEIWPIKRFLYIQQLATRTNSIAAMPRSILRFSTIIFNTAFQMHIHANRNPVFRFLLFLLPQIMVDFAFFRVAVSVLFSGRKVKKQKTKNRWNGRLPICW